MRKVPMESWFCHTGYDAASQVASRYKFFK
jgi:hypothetical protein